MRYKWGRLKRIPVDRESKIIISLQKCKVSNKSEQPSEPSEDPVMISVYLDRENWLHDKSLTVLKHRVFRVTKRDTNKYDDYTLHAIPSFFVKCLTPRRQILEFFLDLKFYVKIKVLAVKCIFQFSDCCRKQQQLDLRLFHSVSITFAARFVDVRYAKRNTSDIRSPYH